jgi:hypothetical protein
MDDAVAQALKKVGRMEPDSHRIAKLKERLEALLLEAAVVDVELSRADGSIRGVPHYSVIEGRAHELGKQLSRESQRQQMNELTASLLAPSKCPGCGTTCEVEVQKRDLKSVDGITDFLERVSHCPGCRRDFFPSA